jgi:hypothetical protein
MNYELQREKMRQKLVGFEASLEARRVYGRKTEGRDGAEKVSSYRYLIFFVSMQSRECHETRLFSFYRLPLHFTLFSSGAPQLSRLSVATKSITIVSNTPVVVVALVVNLLFPLS